MALDLETLKKELNPEQYRAVTSINGAILIIAGAGSGKTRVITFRIAHMLDKGIPQSQILALTFTNKAAKEMADRIKDLTQKKLQNLKSKVLKKNQKDYFFLLNFLMFSGNLLYTIHAINTAMPLSIKLIGIRAMKPAVTRPAPISCRAAINADVPAEPSTPP